VHLSRLGLTDFRSYADVSLELEPGVTTFCGPNGEGKTNLVEAIGYLATLGSHRVATDAPLVRQGAGRAVLRAMVTATGGSTLVELELNPGRANRVRVNRAPLPRPREILGTLRTVLFAPEDLALVKGDPGERRRFLDELLVATAPRYAGVRADYERVLKQRTALLKSAGGKGQLRGTARQSVTATLDTWDAQLARAGAPLLAGRMRLVAALAPHVAAAYETVSGGQPGDVTGMNYRSSTFGSAEEFDDSLTPGTAPAEVVQRDVAQPETALLEKALLRALAGVRASELDRGVCLVGPHRDELELTIGALPARGYASHGESWSLALALRLASFTLLRQGHEDPVLILDDVFAELDAGRRDRLAGLVADAEQVLITAAVAADVPPVLAGARFDVRAGAISRAG
jgi:DNA replication and repair protein RecF